MPSPKRSPFFVTASTFLMLLRCGTGSLPVSSPDEIVAALCQAWSRCGDEIGHLFDDPEDCRAFVSECGQLPLAFANSDAVVNDCASAVEGATCTDLLAIGLFPRLNEGGRSLSDDVPMPGRTRAAIHRVPACSRLWLAFPEWGDPKELGERCEGGGYCHPFDSWCNEDSGVCEDRTAQGGRCLSEYGSRACDLGLTCDDGICSAQQPAPALTGAGGACTETVDCLGGLVCVDESCQQRRAEEQTCNSHAECRLGYSCEEGVCAPFDFCAPQSTTGEQCYLDDGCVAYHWCNDCAFDTPGDGCLHGRCDAFLREGDPCVDGAPWLGRCGPGLVCIVDRCVPGELPRGADCTWARQCVSVSCTDGRCE